MKLDYLHQLQCIERALTLCSSPHAAEFEGLREAYLATRERQQPPVVQPDLLKDSSCANTVAST